MCYGGGFLSELVDGLIAPDVGMGTDPAEFDVNATVSKLLDVSQPLDPVGDISINCRYFKEGKSFRNPSNADSLC